MSRKILYAAAKIESPPNRDAVAKSNFLISRILELPRMFRWFTIKMYIGFKCFRIGTKKFALPLLEYDPLRSRAF